MNFTFETIKFHTKKDVAYVELCRPKVRNALNLQMMKELTSLFHSLKPRTEFRRVQLSGVGKCFCSGADFSWMKQGGELSIEDNLQDSKNLAKLLESLDELPQVVVAVVQGAVMGGGLGLIACCDEVVAHKSTKFRFPEVRLGLLPAIISPYVFSKIPYSQALALTVSARIFDADEAKSYGLIHRIYENESMEEMMADYVGNAHLASQIAKDYLKKEFKPKKDSLLMERVIALLSDVRQNKEAQEGLRAVLEKRTPSWAEKHL